MFFRKLCGCAFVLGLAGILSSATPAPADDKPKAPDFSKYVYVNEVTGEVVKADENKLKIKVTYLAPGKANPNPKARPAAPTQKSMEYEYQFIPDLSLVRFETKSLLPQKTDDKGKKVAYTPKELDALKTPTGVKGYAATHADLTEGSIVNVTLVREKAIPASKATDDDLRIKLAVIQALPKTGAAQPNK